MSEPTCSDCGETAEHHIAALCRLAAQSSDRRRLAVDIATIIARAVQINDEQPPDHWLWDRVMTCDVPRLLRVVESLDTEVWVTLRATVPALAGRG